VLWRPAGRGVEVCLVHRPRYDDWSLPKGKLHAGEHPLACAVREVREETGVLGVPRLRLPSTSYRLPAGEDKRVDWWSLRAADGVPVQPHDEEADDVRWLPPDAAAALLSYPDDRDVLALFARIRTTAAIALVRHARAGKRDTWSGPDEARPLDDAGRAQAEALALLLTLFRPARLLSATPRRCVQTVAALAAESDLTIEADSSFDEPGPGQTKGERAAVAAARLRDLAEDGTTVVVCSQGKVIPGALARLSGDGAPEAFDTPKGTGWVLTFDGSTLVGLDRLSP
jgi:8-oxo-dGTP diphosphatase